MKLFLIVLLAQFMPFSFWKSGGGVLSITANGSNADWYVLTGASTGTTATRTITVPSGSSGVIKLDILKSGSGTMDYKVSAGAFTTFTQGTTIAVANGDTLSFRLTGMNAGSSAYGNVLDSVTNAIVGLVDISSSL